MKELSIEQKAKAYDEALKVLHKYDGANIMFSQSLKEEMFPELKESEDEKTRAEIVRFIQMEVENEIVGNKWLAWLEKQKEFVSADFDDVWETADCDELTAPLEKYSKDAIKKMCHAWYDKGIELERKSWFEKQGENEYTLKSSNNEDVSRLTEQITKFAKDYELNLPNRSYDIYAFAKDILTWLEKQSKIISVNSCKTCKDEQPSLQTNERAWLYFVSDVLTWKDGIGQYLDDPRVQELAKKLCSEYTQKLYNSSVLSNSSNIGKNKIEPRFKVGDWIISHYNHVAYIKSIDEKNYSLSCNDGNSERLSIDYVNRNWRLWTIQDAKDGDVLYAKSTKDIYFRDYIFNFSSFTEDNVISTNFGYDVFHGIFDTKLSRFGREEDFVSVTPATKEQRDLLFTKMKEAGYEWANKPKELK